jgi:hypothetical protein
MYRIPLPILSRIPLELLCNPFYLKRFGWMDKLGYALLITLWWAGLAAFVSSIAYNQASRSLDMLLTLRLDILPNIDAAFSDVATGMYLLCGLGSMLAIQSIFSYLGARAYRVKWASCILGILGGMILFNFIGR